MTCIVNGLTERTSTCSFDVPEDAHRGGVITSQTTLCRNFGGKEGGAYFRRGRISGTLRYITIGALCKQTQDIFQ